METERISCRIGSHKLERLRMAYPGSTTTAIIERLIDYSFSEDSRKSIATKLSDGGIVQLSDKEREGIRLLRNEAARAWKKKNPDKVKAYTKKYHEKHPMDPVKRKEARQRYWLKKLRGGTVHEE